MHSLRQAITGLLLAAASGIMILGGFLIAFTEAGALLPPAQPLPEEMTAIIIFPSPPAPTPPIVFAPTDIPSPTLPPLPTETILPPSSCPPPAGWVPYTIYPGDTLDELARRFNIAGQTLRQANCLFANSLIPGYVLYVPPPAPSPTHCVPPAGWVKYVVKPGDTLYRIALSYGMKADALQRANCLPSADRIIAGASIYVPNIPTLTPVFSPTPVLPPTQPATITPAVPTDTPLSIILMPTATASPTTSPTPSETLPPTSTLTPVSTMTP